MRRGHGPRIVVVSHFCPFPAVHWNRSRLLALLRWLRAQGLQITFVLQPLDVDDRSGISRLAEVVDRLDVVQVHPRGARIRQVVRRIGARMVRVVFPREAANSLRQVFWLRRPSGPEIWGTEDLGGDGSIDRWCWPATCRAVVRAVRRDRPIAVMTEYALLSKCLEGVPGSVSKLIDTVEVFFRQRERFQPEGLAAPFACSPESEEVALRRADVLVAIQKNDAEALRTLFPEKRVITVAHAYRLIRRRESGPVDGTVLYVGSSNPFNVHGLQLFLKQAWPTILDRIPGATLRIVGSMPPVQDVPSPHIVHVGRVSDDELATEYQTAHVVINPQIAGTGLKIKCVEALSAACPLVVNRAGADGLEEGAGTAFLMATDWQDFASHVVRILSDATMRRELEVRARQLAERMFSPDAAFSELVPILTGSRVVL